MADISIRKLAFLTGALALGLSPAAPADSPTAEMLAGACTGCHGTHGASAGSATPTIAGMERVSFVETMQGFQTGEIFSTIMGRIAKGYTEVEIKAMAGYFAEQTFVPAKQPFDSTMVDKGRKLHDKYCEKCHQHGGQQVEGGEYSLLAGQWSPYLHNALSDFLSGAREMPKNMKKRMEMLLVREGDKGLAAIMAYYASEQ